VLNSIIAYKANIQVQDVTKKFLEDYEQYLLNKEHSSTIAKKFSKKKASKYSHACKKMSPTTVGIYMRHLRAIIRQAIELKLVASDAYPFKGYSIPASRNVKKALKLPQIKMLLEYQTGDDFKRKGLDFWLFSYISNGMNFTDICLLKPENIGGEFFRFYRAKTKNTKKKDLRPIKVPLTDLTLAIIEKWRNRNPENPYLFPVLEAGLTPKQIKYKIQDFIRKVNEVMNSIAKELGIPTKINTYVARHSHSTILKRQGVSTEFIKENLGHSSVITTENYLDDFEDDVKSEYAKLLTDFDSKK
jgi:integrase/recombinase XerD